MAARKEVRSRHSHRPQRTDSPTSFFKIILADTLQAKKMMMPQKFVKYFGDDLSNEATLIVPNGGVWQVELTKSVNQIWFERNFSQFAEYYSLCHGHVLHFEYKSFYTFDVKIYDMSCCEISYPYEDNDSVEVAADSPYATPSTPSWMKKEGKSTNIKEPGSSKQNKGTRKRGKGFASGTNIFDSGFRKENQQSEGIIRSSRMFESWNPYMQILLQKYNFKCGFVYVPAQFYRWHMTEQDYVELKVSDGRQWGVKVNRKNNGRVTLGAGISAFYMENDLKVGDICVFELADDNVFKVSLYVA